MKNYISAVLYMIFFGTLWYTFSQGHNVYLDRLIGIMTVVYFLTNAVLTLAMGIIGYANSELKKGKSFASVKGLKSPDALEKALKTRTSAFYRAYRYLGFYPAILCAGVLLGNYWLFAAMLYDAVMGQVLFSQLEDTAQILKEKFNVTTQNN